MCDFRKRRPLEDVPTFRQVCDPAQPIAIVQIGPEHHRFSFMLDRDETAESATDERARLGARRPLPRPDDAELVRVANYVFRSRIAERWRDGPIMLAGDAAHEMPPFLAQGMCSGIRDSHNLAWKLDLVLRGPPALTCSTPTSPSASRTCASSPRRRSSSAACRRCATPSRRACATPACSPRGGRAEQPEKLRFPGLSAGLIAARVGAGGRDLPAGARPCGTPRRALRRPRRAGPVHPRPRPGAARGARVGARALAGAARGADRRRSAAAATAERARDGRTVADSDRTYVPWFAARGCEAAVIRPDWYLYGRPQAARSPRCRRRDGRARSRAVRGPAPRAIPAVQR